MLFIRNEPLKYENNNKTGAGLKTSITDFINDADFTMVDVNDLQK